MYGRNFAGRGQRGRIGFGFRGRSPIWPYVGRGRGGLPRCSYFLTGALAPAYQPLTEGRAAGYRYSSSPVSKEEKLGYLGDQAKAIKEQLDNIESRMHDLEAKE